jgi:hypothetical protein
LTRALRRQLSSSEDRASPVIWSEGDSEIVVYSQELRVALQPGLTLVELPVASDQTGKSALVVAFSIGKSPQDATLLALTESTLRGDPLLASRWSYAVQEVLWQALLKSVQDCSSRCRRALPAFRTATTWWSPACSPPRAICTTSLRG